MAFVSHSIFQPAQDVKIFKLEHTSLYEADAKDRLIK